MRYSEKLFSSPYLPADWLPAMYGGIAAFLCFPLAFAFVGYLNSHVVYLWFILAGLFVGTQGAGLAQSIVRGNLVLRQLRTPTGLRTSYLRAVLSNATTTWALFCAAGVALLWLTHSAWASATGFFSIVLSVFTLTGLPSSSIAVRFWQCFLYTLAMLLTPLTLWKGYFNPIDHLPQLPLWILALAPLSWPLTIWVIAGKWNGDQAFTSDRPALPKIGVFERLSAYGAHYSQLAYSTQSSHLKPSLFGKLTSFVTMQYLSLLMLSNLANARWNHEVGPYHFLGILMIASLCCNLLIFKDFHWRTLLSPGRWQRNAFGWRIFSVSVLAQLFVYAALAGVWTLVAMVSFDVSPIQTLEKAWSLRAVPLQLLAANSLALVLMVTCSPRWAGVIGIGIAVSLAGMTFAIYGFSFKSPVWFYVGPNYLLGLGVFTAVCVLLSNRLWTRQQILRHLHTS